MYLSPFIINENVLKYYKGLLKKMIDKSKYTPMMQQYLTIKESYQDAIVFFRLGDFYEMFFDDAQTASRELEIFLTGRDAGVSERVPMCGVPFHAYSSYAERLVAKGYKVAIVEQTESPAEAKGIVSRDVVKVLTPGTITFGTNDSKTNNYIGCLYEENKEYILTYADVLTGDFFLQRNSSLSDIIKEIQDLDVKELVIDSKGSRKIALSLSDCSVALSPFSDKAINHEFSYVTEKENEAINLLLNYIMNAQRQDITHYKPLIRLENDDYLMIDMFSKRNLELTETLRTSSKNGSLLYLLDKCQTAMGSRMLRRWIEKPLVKRKEIEARLDIVTAFYDDFILREDVTNYLREIYDLERIIGRISTGNANGRDLLQLRKSLQMLPLLKNTLSTTTNQAIKDLNDQIADFSLLSELLLKALLDEQPITIKEGNMFIPEFDAALNEIYLIKQNSTNWILEYEQAERIKTGIKNLKVGYNRVFGYYIEITKSNLNNDFSNYERKQTLANAERFITPELKHYESVVLNASERIVNIEYELFIKLRDDVMTYTARLQELATVLASIDCYVDFANIAKGCNYVRPTFNDKLNLNILGGRHPVIESLIKGFVANDCIINKFNTLLITGPNMSGKSTYMRMIALTAIMGQMGCYVPAIKADLPIYDKIFTRIGASDDLVMGQSTFMVEMLEANYAIVNATKNSLILFDEIGRGTATFDGLALAQAILEYVHEKIGCTVMFSTHYHELVALEKTLTRLKNIHVAAKEEANKVVFLHKVLDGAIDKSYGINVAALAKLPRSLIARSKDLLSNLETDGHAHKIDLNLFDFNAPVTVEKDYSELIQAIHQADIDTLSPLDCMRLLLELKEMLNDGE